ncbi:MAG TPA: serine hydrolase domain-containing protein, partial [Roseimicrobium sp.]|nr:serine hydrolase domain-containing protein [Roseimicrobium sp.]
MTGLLPSTLRALEAGIQSGDHLGAQLYVNRGGEVIANVAVGEASSGVPLTTGHVMLWMSAGKPITAIAIASLVGKELLRLDTRVADLVPGFGAGGKEEIRLEHLLTHTAGFRSADALPESLVHEERITRICESPIEAGWKLGEKAGYQISSSWDILGEIIQRVTGQSASNYCHTVIFDPLGMEKTWIGIPETDQAGLSIAPVHITSQSPARPHPTLNRPAWIAAERPGSNARGPVSSLARFYEHLNHACHDRRTTLPVSNALVREFVARRRIGLFDHTFKHTMDWALGFAVNSN